MKLKKTNTYLITFLTSILLSCTTTTTKIKNPEFSDQVKVQNELSNLVKAENINLNGKEITKNKKTSSELEVSIINGQNIPDNIEQQKALEKSIATCIKKNLKNPNEFESYKILLVKKTENSGVKNKSWTGNSFKASEL